MVIKTQAPPMLRQREAFLLLALAAQMNVPHPLAPFLHRRRYFSALGWSPHSALLQRHFSRSVLDGSSLSDPCHRRPAMWFLNIAFMTRQICSLVV